MKAKLLTVTLATSIALMGSKAYSTNGDNMIAIGPVARGMGGVTIANPQDAISAVFGNPAAMCFSRYCPSSQVDFGGTVFMPSIDASVTNAFGMNQTIAASSKDNVYPIPAIGLSIPLGDGKEKWRFGLAAYGVSGLGVDYRETAIDQKDIFGPGAPLVAGDYTSLQIMKFAPAISYQVAHNFSLGGSFHIDYATLDLGAGSAPGFGYGVQLGSIWRPAPNISVGLSYTTPQKVRHENVIAQPTPTGGIARYDLNLEAPDQIGLGLSWEGMDNRLILSGEVKQINWGSAEGYKDFDWKDQTVWAGGIQYEVLREKLFLRAGFNYGENPVRANNNWNGSFTPTGPADVTFVQGVPFPTYYYETFRIVGFPAVVESHATFGLSYAIKEGFNISLAYLHAYGNDIVEQGVGPAGTPVSIKSKLSEESVEFGFSWKF
jgi:long-chain fatty acid transport protein